MTGNIHDNELGYFTDSLTPHQRVVLHRLLGDCLSPCPRGIEAESLGTDAVAMLIQGLEPLYDLLDQLRLFAANDTDSDIRPFSFSIPEPGHGLIRVSSRINSWPKIWEPGSHDWVTPARLGRLTIDLSRLRELTSGTIAWLVTLARYVPNNKVSLVGANPSMRRSISVLNLNQILICE